MQTRRSGITTCAGIFCALVLLVLATVPPAQALSAPNQVSTQLLASAMIVSRAKCHNHCQPTCPSKSQCKHAMRAPEVRLRSGRTRPKAVRLTQLALVTSVSLARARAAPKIIGEPYVFLYPGTPFKTVFALTMSMLN